jgi:hypothetical protein
MSLFTTFYFKFGTNTKQMNCFINSFTIGKKYVTSLYYKETKELRQKRPHLRPTRILTEWPTFQVTTTYERGIDLVVVNRPPSQSRSSNLLTFHSITFLNQPRINCFFFPFLLRLNFLNQSCVKLLIVFFFLCIWISLINHVYQLCVHYSLFFFPFVFE